MATLCSDCGAKQPILAGFYSEMSEGRQYFFCPDCRSKREVAAEERLRILQEKAAQVILTTTPTVEGRTVLRYLGIESVEFVIGTGLFSEITTDFQDFFGQRSSAFETKLQQAKAGALQTLQMRAAKAGANAVLAVDIDYTEFTGNRIGLIINGTLVEVTPP